MHKHIVVSLFSFFIIFTTNIYSMNNLVSVHNTKTNHVFLLTMQSTSTVGDMKNELQQQLNDQHCRIIMYPVLSFTPLTLCAPLSDDAANVQQIINEYNTGCFAAKFGTPIIKQDL